MAEIDLGHRQTVVAVTCAIGVQQYIVVVTGAWETGQLVALTVNQ